MSNPTPKRPNQPIRELSGPLLLALLAGDDPDVRRIFDEARRRGADLAVIALDLVGPALCQVGEMWRRGVASVAEEHLASALVSRELACLGASIPCPGAGAPRILFSCAEGEFHELGVRIASDIAREAGWEAENLGANVPRDAVVGFVATRRPDALGLSLSLSGHIAEAVKTIEAVRNVSPSTRILVGGRAVEADPELTDLLPADAAVPDVVALRDWLVRNRPKAAHAKPRPLPPLLPAGLRRKLGRRG